MPMADWLSQVVMLTTSCNMAESQSLETQVQGCFNKKEGEKHQWVPITNKQRQINGKRMWISLRNWFELNLYCLCIMTVDLLVSQPLNEVGFRGDYVSHNTHWPTGDVLNNTTLQAMLRSLIMLFIFWFLRSCVCLMTCSLEIGR